MYQLHVSESEHENTSFFLKRADKRTTLNFGLNGVNKWLKWSKQGVLEQGYQ